MFFIVISVRVVGRRVRGKLQEFTFIMESDNREGFLEEDKTTILCFCVQKIWQHQFGCLGNFRFIRFQLGSMKRIWMYEKKKKKRKINICNNNKHKDKHQQ